MPKAKTKNKAKSQDKEKQKKAQADEDELSELLQKSLQESAKEAEAAESEEDIDLAALEVHQFSKQGGETGSVVLEKIAGSQAVRPRFFGTAGTEAEGEIKYEAGVRAENEPMYSSSQTANINYEESQTIAAEPPILRPSGMSEARERFLDRSSAFVSDEERQERSRNEPAKFATETFRGEDRRLPFESHEKKYKEFRPRKMG